jgi:hypothetical protein
MPEITVAVLIYNEEKNLEAGKDTLFSPVLLEK